MLPNQLLKNTTSHIYTCAIYIILFIVAVLNTLAQYFIVMSNTSETITDEIVQRMFSPDTVLAEIRHPEQPPIQYRMSDTAVTEKLEKFVEDVKFGIYPLTAYKQRPAKPRPASPEMAESVKSASPEPVDVEARRVVNMMCNVKPKEQSCDLMMTILLRMDDKMNRQLTCHVSEIDNSIVLAQELVFFGFINEADKDKISLLIEETLHTGNLARSQQAAAAAAAAAVVQNCATQQMSAAAATGGGNPTILGGATGGAATVVGGSLVGGGPPTAANAAATPGGGGAPGGGGGGGGGGGTCATQAHLPPHAPAPPVQTTS